MKINSTRHLICKLIHVLDEDEFGPSHDSTKKEEILMMDRCLMKAARVNHSKSGLRVGPTSANSL